MRVASVALLACAGVTAWAGQVHVAFGPTDSELSVAWASNEKGGNSVVLYGESENALKQNNTGDIRAFTQDAGRTWYTRTAMMTGLKVNTKYYYKVGDSVNGFSDIFSVWNRRTRSPFRHILYGDMGAAAAFTLCAACQQHSTVCDAATCSSNTTAGLVSEVDVADIFVHVGDFAYDLDTDNGKVGDQFMENIEQVAARVPYMVSHGNHEDRGGLAHYVERFRSQPSNAVPSTFTTTNGETTNTLYFSWDFGGVHYISFSSELWHGVNSTQPTVNHETFLKWLEDDLIKANQNRDKFPWILAHDHRPLYTSADQYSADPAVKAALEPLFFKYGVDFSVNGHQHNYERSYPLYNNKSTPSYENPGATIYVVTGAAGSREMHTPFTFPQPPWCAFRANTFSYTRMFVYNATHVHFQQVATDPTEFPTSQYGEIIDSWWVYQNNHGPFSPENAPKTVRTECPECVTIDHFEPLLNMDDGSGRPLDAIIRDYRATHGEVAWARKLDSLLQRMNARLNQTFVWEDGNLDQKTLNAMKWAHTHDA